MRRAWRSPFTISCDFARQNIVFVAAAACLGLITTRVSDTTYGRSWHVTAGGLRALNESENE